MENILERLKNYTPGVRAIALVSIDGLMITSILPNEMEGEKIAAISAALLHQGESSSADAVLGNLEQVITKAKKGHIIITRVGTETILTIFTNEAAKLGLVLYDIECAIRELKDHVN